MMKTQLLETVVVVASVIAVIHTTEHSATK